MAIILKCTETDDCHALVGILRRRVTGKAVGAAVFGVYGLCLEKWNDGWDDFEC